MKAVIMTFLFAFVWVGAQAADRIEKNNPRYSAIQFSGGLIEGGETFASAVQVNLPFMGGGNTCDNLDDYDEVCPHTGSTAPDVVYTFIPERMGLLSADLCGSTYDTKLMLYDEKATLIACNDDYYSDDQCGMYVSFFSNILVHQDKRYFLVVDGFGKACGDYHLKVNLLCVDPICEDAQCPANGLLEGEPSQADNGLDQFNGGCDSPEPVFQELFQLPGHDELNFCGSTGWYLQNAEFVRDTDWFKMVATGDVIELEAQSSHHMPVQCSIIRHQECSDLDIQTFEMGICNYDQHLIPTTAGEIIYFRVQPQQLSPGECADLQDLYRLKINGIFGTVVSTENVSWDSIKSYYR